MFNLFNLRRPSDFKKEKHNGEERGRDVENFRQQMFSMDVCFSSSNPHASRDSVNSQEIREGLPEGKRPEGKTLEKRPKLFLNTFRPRFAAQCSLSFPTVISR